MINSAYLNVLTSQKIRVARCAVVPPLVLPVAPKDSNDKQRQHEKLCDAVALRRPFPRRVSPGSSVVRNMGIWLSAHAIRTILFA